MFHNDKNKVVHLLSWKQKHCTVPDILSILMKCFRLFKAEGKGNHGLQKLLNMYDILTSIKRDGSSPITGTYVMTFHFEVTKCMYYYNLTFKLNIHGHILGKCTYSKRTYRHYIYIFIFRQKGLHKKCLRAWKSVQI